MKADTRWFDRNAMFVLALLIVGSLWLHWPHMVSLIGDTNRDFFIHYNWAKEMADNLRDGAVYPRWVFHGSLELGDPTFIYYSPLFYVLVGMIVRSGVTVWQSIQIVDVVSNAGFAWIIWQIARAYGNSCLGIFIALAALFNPFIVMLYYKFGGWAWASMGYFSHALLLWAVLRPTANRLRINVPAAVAIALAVWSHVISALIGLIVVSIVVLVRDDGRGWASASDIARAAVAWAGTVTFGIALSAAYLFPAVMQINDINVQVWEGPLFLKAFAWPTITLALHGAQWISFQWPVALPALLLFLAGSFYAVRCPDVMVQTRIYFPLLAMSAVSLFLASELSYPLWAFNSPMTRIQLPYRFLFSLYVVGLLLEGLALSHAWRAGRRLLGFILAIPMAVSLLVGISIWYKANYLDGRPLPALIVDDQYTYGPAKQRLVTARKLACGPEDSGECPRILLESGPYIGLTEYQLKWRGPDYVAYARQGFEGECARLVVICKLTARLGNGRAWTILATEPILVRLPLNYYPSWTMMVNGEERETLLDRHTGLIAVALSEGRNIVVVRWRLGLWERIGLWTNLAALLGLVCIIVYRSPLTIFEQLRRRVRQLSRNEGID